MRIIAIRGKNIASLEGEFEVDFTSEPLASANIFAISGPTGAGKSSLLDTMCLALFARTPRTEQAKELNVRLKDISDDVLVQSDPRFLLRRGTANGYAETDFIALDGYRYRARWSVSRAREKENGRLQSPRLNLVNLDKETEEQGTRSDLQQRIIELIGLTFDQFTRSVLLAQNDFSTFLKAEQSEKAALLEKLTGTELYSQISRRIYEKNTEARAAFESIQTQMAGIELLSEEEENSLRLQSKDLEVLLKQLEIAKKEWQTRNEAVNSTTILLTKKEADQKEAGERLTHALQLRDQAKLALDTKTKEMTALIQTLKELQPQLREARQLDVELIHAEKQLTEHKKQLVEVENKNKNAEKRVSAIASSLKQGEAEITNLKEWFVKYKEKETIAAQLPSLLLHLDAAERTYALIEKNRKEKEKALHESTTLTQKAVAANQLATRKEEELKELNTQCKQAEEEIKKVNIAETEQQKEVVLAKREQLLQEQLLFSSAGKDAKELREKLTENRPCPVCGSTDHPYASKEMHAKMQEIQAETIRLTQQINTLDRLLKDTAAKRTELDKLRERMVAANKELTDIEKSCAEQNSSISLLDSRVKQLRATQKEYVDELNRALSATNRLFGNDLWQTKWKQDPLDFRQKLTSFVADWQTKEKRIQELERVLSGLKSEQSSYTEFVAALQKELIAVKEIHNAHLSAYQEIKQKRNLLLDGKPANTVETAYNELIEQKKKEADRLQQTLTEQSGIADQARGQQGQIAKDLAALTETRAVARKALAEWLDKYHETSNGILPEERWSKAIEMKSGIDFRLKNQEANRKKIAGLKEEADRKQLISEQWAKLNDLAGSADGGKFRRIAQSYTLDVLLNYANVQLQSLTNRYRLERVPDTLALQVIDREMCDEIRTVHSLSGGESFLVSLALALGLSSLSSNRMKVESLFIDEGFGSLDAETLRVAMDALENLRTQGRKIGVISHVHEMTERIPVRICVNRLGSGRSRIVVEHSDS